MKNEIKLPDVSVFYSPNYDKVRKRIPSFTINPLHSNEKEREKSFENSRINDSILSPRKDYSPKNYKSPSKRNSPKSIFNDKKSKNKDIDNVSFLDKVILLKQQHYDVERKREEIELKQKSKKIKYRIDKDYNTFLNNMYENSLKFYNMTLNAKLSNKKYAFVGNKKIDIPK